MSGALARWNALPVENAVKEILPCCGSKTWADEMAARRPFPDVTTLLAASDETWSSLTAEDWMEAFRSHPRIGESRAVHRPRQRSRPTGRRKNKRTLQLRTMP
jgi:2-oxo-4-hydroxy-4-carboxy-5-ureidoimidazoline decarboxylase